MTTASPTPQSDTDLKSEVENLRGALSETLEQQTATAEILRVIASSPTDLQPVFDVIVRSAVRLCGGLHGTVYRAQDGLIHLLAHYNFSPEALAFLQGFFPIPVSAEGSIPARVIRDAAVTHQRDAQGDANVPEITRRTTRALGARSVLFVPILHHESAIGVIVISRSEVKEF